MSDLIKREDAIKAVVSLHVLGNEQAIRKEYEKYSPSACVQFEETLVDVLNAIETIPSADRPQGEWIPCSERLPKKYEQVLCCNKDGRVFSSALTYVHPEYKYWYFGKHRSVIAWMPLPKPWKGADDE